jgi:hypothetical protein
MDSSESPRECRIRRLAMIIMVLAVIATVLGMIPGGIEDVGCCGDEPNNPEGPMLAGGWTLVAWTVINGWIARGVYRHPTLKNANSWCLSSLFSIPLGLMVWGTGERDLQSLSIEWHTVGEAMGACMGAVALLLVLALPIIADASKGSPAPAAAPTAHVVR